ncbi:MAG: putative capsid protein [Circoviridae sp.]|nr:MAG: putative capsid protein [Circoviridae sp.]
METDATRRNARPRDHLSMPESSRNRVSDGSERSTPRSSRWTLNREPTHGSRQSHLLEVETEMRPQIPSVLPTSTRTINCLRTCDSTSSLESGELLLRCSSQCLPTWPAVQFSGRVPTRLMRYCYQLLQALGCKLWRLIRPDHATRTSQSVGSTIQLMPTGDSGSSIATLSSSIHLDNQLQYHSTGHSCNPYRARQST